MVQLYIKPDNPHEDDSIGCNLNKDYIDALSKQAFFLENDINSGWESPGQETANARGASVKVSLLAGVPNIGKGVSDHGP